jgi:hypothetical protein
MFLGRVSSQFGNGELVRSINFPEVGRIGRVLTISAHRLPFCCTKYLRLIENLHDGKVIFNLELVEERLRRKVDAVKAGHRIAAQYS